MWSFSLHQTFFSLKLTTLRGAILEDAVPSTAKHGTNKGLPLKEVLEYVVPELNIQCLRLAINSPKVPEQLLKLDQQGVSDLWPILLPWLKLLSCIIASLCVTNLVCVKVTKSWSLKSETFRVFRWWMHSGFSLFFLHVLKLLYMTGSCTIVILTFCVKSHNAEFPILMERINTLGRFPTLKLIPKTETWMERVNGTWFSLVLLLETTLQWNHWSEWSSLVGLPLRHWSGSSSCLLDVL